MSSDDMEDSIDNASARDQTSPLPESTGKDTTMIDVSATAPTVDVVRVKSEDVEEGEDDEDADDEEDQGQGTAGAAPSRTHGGEAKPEVDAVTTESLEDDTEGAGDAGKQKIKAPHIRFTFGGASKRNKQLAATGSAAGNGDAEAGQEDISADLANSASSKRRDLTGGEQDSEVDELEDEGTASGARSAHSAGTDARSNKKRKLHGEADPTSTRSSARLHRPPPLESIGGPPNMLGGGGTYTGRPGPLTPLSAVLASRPQYPQVVSPAVSGFPFHAADKPTMESVRHAMQIKEAQRTLIAKRKQGEVPLTVESPGIGPPPSAGWAPSPSIVGSGTAQSGGVTGSIGSRRGSEAKAKTQKLRVSTEGHARGGGLQSAPPGQARHNIVVTENSDDEDDDESDANPARPPAAEPVRPGSDRPWIVGANTTYKPPQPIIASGSQPRPVPTPNGHPAFPLKAGPSAVNGYPSGVNGFNPSGPPGFAAGPGILGPPPGMRKPTREFNGRPPGERSEPPLPHSVYMAPPSSSSSGRVPPMHAPYPPRTEHERGPPMGFPSGPMAPPPPPLRNSNREGGRRLFLEHFSTFYDALVDSQQLRQDLAQKVQKADELIAAQEEQLGRLRSVRREYEHALGDLKMRSQGTATNGHRPIEDVARMAALEREMRTLKEAMRTFSAEGRHPAGASGGEGVVSDDDHAMDGSD